MPYTLSFEQQGPSWQLLFCMKLKPKSDASANSWKMTIGHVIWQLHALFPSSNDIHSGVYISIIYMNVCMLATGLVSVWKQDADRSVFVPAGESEHFRFHACVQKPACGHVQYWLPGTKIIWSVFFSCHRVSIGLGNIKNTATVFIVYCPPTAIQITPTGCLSAPLHTAWRENNAYLPATSLVTCC